jgi:hypothetical protein
MQTMSGFFISKARHGKNKCLAFLFSKSIFFERSTSMERLIGAILLKAVEDWNDPKKRPEIEEFLESEWFNALAEILSLDPVHLRNQLRQGTHRRMSLRAAYR